MSIINKYQYLFSSWDYEFLARVIQILSSNLLIKLVKILAVYGHRQTESCLSEDPQLC